MDFIILFTSWKSSTPTMTVGRYYNIKIIYISYKNDNIMYYTLYQLKLCVNVFKNNIIYLKTRI